MPDVAQPAEKVKDSNSPAKKGASDVPDIDEFEWLQYQDQGDQRGRITNALLQNPLVPIGAAATVIALAGGLYNMRKQNSVRQQFFMRARVGAQGFTIASLLGGIFYQTHIRDVENQEKLNKSKAKQEESMKNQTVDKPK